ncbi:MAG TPA: hypothetical protein VH478_07135 [Trebonia sp.]|nr:hypothetical protein [Trebonia sp.]
MRMRRGHAVAIAISFGFQAAMFAAIGAISSYLNSNNSGPVAAAGINETSPGFAWGGPPTAQSDEPGLRVGPFSVSVSDGTRAGTDLFPLTSHLPSFTVTPDSQATFTITVTDPAGPVPAMIGIASAPWGAAGPAAGDVLMDTTLTAVTTDLTVGWAVPNMAPGSQELLYMSAEGPDGTVEEEPIAELTAD